MNSQNDYLVNGRLGRVAMEFIEHKSQIPVLIKINDKLDEIFRGLALSTSNHPNIKYTVQRVQYQFHLQRISEINCSLTLCLKKELYTATEALSRISLESTVNFLYLLGEKENERASGVIKGYLKKNRYKAKKWLEHSLKEKDEDGAKHASRLLEAMEYGLSALRHRKDRQPKMWPESIKQKFAAVGLEGAYLTLFSSSSDSVHAGAEDIYNRNLVELLEEEEKEEAVKVIVAERVSFAIYLAICSIEYSAEALYGFCDKINEKELMKPLSELKKELKELHMQHEIHHANLL